MASIRARKKKDGSTSYSAQIVIKHGGIIKHRESRTFSKDKLARAWAKKREVELQYQEVFDTKDPIMIADILQEYLDNFTAEGSKKLDMNRLMTYDIAKINVYDLSSAHLIQHCIARNKEAKPQTVKNDVIWLRVALSTIKGLHDYDYDLDMFDAASKVLRKEGLIASSDKRDRLPTTEELWKLSRHFNRSKTHYLHIFWFAIYSARRLSEICNLRWDDINHDDRTIIVRDMKTPNKKPLTLRAKLPLSAYKIIMKQPHTNARIFPYESKTISSYFTKSCKLLDIANLHFHDMRHLAVTNLFKKGLGIHQVALVSLHQSWTTLKIYVKDNPGDLDI